MIDWGLLLGPLLGGIGGGIMGAGQGQERESFSGKPGVDPTLRLGEAFNNVSDVLNAFGARSNMPLDHIFNIRPRTPQVPQNSALPFPIGLSGQFDQTVPLGTPPMYGADKPKMPEKTPAYGRRPMSSRALDPNQPTGLTADEAAAHLIEIGGRFIPKIKRKNPKGLADELLAKKQGKK